MQHREIEVKSETRWRIVNCKTLKIVTRVARIETQSLTSDCSFQQLPRYRQIALSQDQKLKRNLQLCRNFVTDRRT